MDNTETKKVMSFIILNGVICPVYKEIDEDDRREWNN